MRSFLSNFQVRCSRPDRGQTRCRQRAACVCAFCPVGAGPRSAPMSYEAAPAAARQLTGRKFQLRLRIQELHICRLHPMSNFE